MNSKSETGETSDLETAMQVYLENESPESKETVISIGQAMANYYAGIYSPGIIDEDLKHAAGEGFLLALKRFDPSRKVMFTTYATHCIISEIRQELRTRKLFEMPDWLIRLQEDVINATEELSRQSSSMPTLQDIAEKVNIAEKGISEAMQAGSRSLSDIDLSSLKSLRNESFKLPIEDMIAIRKSMDRLNDIQKKVLSLISVNLRELSLAIEEEDLALTKTQVQHARIVENCSDAPVLQKHLEGFKINFPEQFSEEEVLRYFEVLSDEFGLHLVDLRCEGTLKKEDRSTMSMPVAIDLEGRYRGLLQLLDHVRSSDKICVQSVRTARNENIPARINIYISLITYYHINNIDSE